MSHIEYWPLRLTFDCHCFIPFSIIIIGQRRPLYFQYELLAAERVGRAVDGLLNDWTKIVYLYGLVHEFAEQYTNGMMIT